MPKRGLNTDLRFLLSKRSNAKKRKVRSLVNCETIVVEKSQQHRLLKELYTSPTYRVAVSVPERDLSPVPAPLRLERQRSNLNFWLIWFFFFGVFYVFPYDVPTSVKPTSPTKILPEPVETKEILPVVEETWQIVLPKAKEPDPERELCFFLSDSQPFLNQNYSVLPSYSVVCITL